MKVAYNKQHLSRKYNTTKVPANIRKMEIAKYNLKNVN